MMRTALVALVVGAVLAVSTGCGIRIMKYEFSDDHVVAEKFASVKVRGGNDAGDLTIRYQQGLTETKIHRRVEHSKDNKPSGVSHRVEGDALVLEGCGDDCEINYDVLVPDAKITVQGETGSGDASFEGVAAVDYRTGSGRVKVTDVAGDVRSTSGSGDFEAARIGGGLMVEVGSGNVILDLIKGKTMVVTHSGDVTGTGIDNEVTADASSGNVSLTLLSERSVRANSGSGDINLRIPGGPFRIVGQSGSGDRRITVPTDPAARTELKLDTGSGDIRVVGI
ncbi:DUF4097 family beta strand repeat-containing protein [Lentzea sp. NEAU-D7]|uniref:DUF4097 family beta strand repeat-containing protein n=1 Tax=Lentzea sp. NEAU-D7 TaxID=2994667 RepID=UPI00224AAD16|nr:DUF4097 family beta strand repeat-containing protein [Lentzea sp. NEAU-D7]MCX2948322.1 DUF4097 family beta strand repeat-containing protein [Lentzea sp. NEAU-D7]